MTSMGRIVAMPAAAGAWAMFVTLLLAAGPAAAAGSAEAGETKAVVCTACHGPEGNSLNPMWPSLAGQNAAYITHTLHAFKSGERSDPLMSAQAAALSDQDVQDLAAYFASRTRTPGASEPEQTAAGGERLYRGGNRKPAPPPASPAMAPTAPATPRPAIPPSPASRRLTWLRSCAPIGADNAPRTSTR